MIFNLFHIKISKVQHQQHRVENQVTLPMIFMVVSDTLSLPVWCVHMPLRVMKRKVIKLP